MEMKLPSTVLGLALLFAPAAAQAIAVPLPTSDSTLNVNLQFQPQFLVNEAGTPDGTGPSYDFLLRRVRLAVDGNVTRSFSYYFQIDNPNFGKFGNNNGRVAVQDAWVGWAPTGIEGGTVVYIDAGLLFIPVSRHFLVSTTNFITADAQTDGFRLPSSNFIGFRDVGVQVRGWAFDKKIGFRGGVHEGYAPIVQATAASPQRGTQPSALSSTSI
jgi:hypothetical protein